MVDPRLAVNTNNVSLAWNELRWSGLLCALIGEWCTRDRDVAGVHSNHFYRTMLCSLSAVMLHYSMSSVCPSVCDVQVL